VQCVLECSRLREQHTIAEHNNIEIVRDAGAAAREALELQLGRAMVMQDVAEEASDHIYQDMAMLAHAAQ
jgi:hypothetical protein